MGNPNYTTVDPNVTQGGLAFEWGPIVIDRMGRPDAGEINRQLAHILLGHLDRDPSFLTFGTPAIQRAMQQVTGDAEFELTNPLKIASSGIWASKGSEGNESSEGTWGEAWGTTKLVRDMDPAPLPMLMACNQPQRSTVRQNLRLAGWREEDAALLRSLPKGYRKDVPGQPWIGSPSLMLVYKIASRVLTKQRARKNPIQLHPDPAR